MPLNVIFRVRKWLILYYLGMSVFVPSWKYCWQLHQRVHVEHRLDAAGRKLRFPFGEKFRQ